MRVSKKYGLNPSVQQCPCCGKDMGIILFGAGYKDKDGKTAEAPHMIAIPGQICDSCRDIIENKEGVFIIEVRDGEKGENPYRTGRLIAIKRSRAAEMFGEVHSIAYMEQSMFEPLFGHLLKEEEKQTNAETGTDQESVK